MDFVELSKCQPSLSEISAFSSADGLWSGGGKTRKEIKKKKTTHIGW